MGRQRTTEPVPVPVEIVKQTFATRQDGVIIRRSCHIDALAHEPATFRGPGDKLMVRVYVDGGIRRLLATRIAWVLATGSWPDGPVLPRNGVDDDLRAENLIKVRHGKDPFGAISDKHSKGGKASALHERQVRNKALLKALNDNPGATLPQISQLIGSSTSCTCVRLAKLEAQGLTCSPKGQAHVRWELSQAGRALAAAADPVILDSLDTDILETVASAPMKQLELARRLGVCSLTIKRRVTRLIDAGMVTADRDRRFRISGSGVTALGGGPALKPVERWVRPELVSAASARGVVERQEHHSNDDRTFAQRSAHGTMARLQSSAAHRLRKREGDTFGEFDRMAG